MIPETIRVNVDVLDYELKRLNTENERLKTELAEVKRFLQELYHSGELKGVWKMRIERFVK